MLYVALLIIAIALNWSYKKNLLLVLVVGFSGLLPMQMVTDYYAWWTICIGFELFKIGLAVYLMTRISYPVAFLCSLMLACHLIIMFAINQAPHTIIVPALEHLEILSCILFSHPALLYLKRKIKCRWK